MSKRNKHQIIIYDLEQRLINSSYDTIDKNVVYGSKIRTYGEIDLYALRGKYGLYFEIKSNHTKNNYKKARKQLIKIKDLFASDTRNWYFYVYGTDDGYSINKIKI